VGKRNRNTVSPSNEELHGQTNETMLLRWIVVL